MSFIYVFNGSGNGYPSGAFSNFEKASIWIKENKLSGMLTKMPVDISIYDWAISNEFFEPKKE